MSITMVQAPQSVKEVNNNKTQVKPDVVQKPEENQIDTEDIVIINRSEYLKCMGKQAGGHLAKTGAGVAGGYTAGAVLTRYIPILAKPFTAASASVWGLIGVSGATGAIVGNFTDDNKLAPIVGAGTGAVTGAIWGAKAGGWVPALTGAVIGAASGAAGSFVSSTFLPGTKIKL